MSPAGSISSYSADTFSYMTVVFLRAYRETRHYLRPLSPLVSPAGIKEPSRWQTLPFNRLDSAAIVSRRTFLERYLGQLCARPHLSTSDELKEFMAYETDGSIAFIRKPVISVPRIDQVRGGSLVWPRDWHHAACCSVLIRFGNLRTVCSPRKCSSY